MTEPTPASDSSSGLAGAVARGSFWMMLNAFLQRGASFLSQVVLGWLLSERDFGLYALAMSIYSVASVLRDGGVRQLLVQQQQDYARLVGPLFWMATAFNVGTGVVIAILAPICAHWFSEPALTPLLLMIAIAQPLATPGAIFSVRLSIELRFREAARITTVSNLIRYGGTVGLALIDFGPMSFVAPLPLLSVLEGVLGYAYTREQPWRLRPAVSTWLSTLVHTRWLFIGTFATAAINLGAGIAIRPFVSTEVVGVYFFAFQIIVQVGMLLSGNLTQVFFSAFARITGEPTRISAAAARALRQLMLIAAPMCLGLAATFGPLEVLVWRGKWAAAADAVQVIGFLYPAVIATTVPQALQQASGQFRASGLTLLAVGLASLGGSALGALAWKSALGIALATSGATAVVSVLITLGTLRVLGVGWAESIRSLGLAWLLAALAALASLTLDRRLEGFSPVWLRILSSAAAFGVLFSLSARLFLLSHLREAISAIPARFRAPVARLLGA